MIVIKILKVESSITLKFYAIILSLILGFSLFNVRNLFVSLGNNKVKGTIVDYEIEEISPGRGSDYTIYIPIVEIIDNGVPRQIKITDAKTKVMPNHIGDKVDVKMFDDKVFIDTLFYKLLALSEPISFLAFFAIIGVITSVASNLQNLKGMSLKNKALLSVSLLPIALSALIMMGRFSYLEMNKIGIVHFYPKIIICSTFILVFLFSVIILMKDCMENRRKIIAEFRKCKRFKCAK